MAVGSWDAGFEAFAGALLSSVAPTASYVEAFRRTALQNVDKYEELWSALRARLVRSDANSAEAQGLWFLIDAVMKDAPLVYINLVAPKLPDLIEAHMPWEQVSQLGDVASSDSKLWFTSLVQGWKGVLPDHDYERTMQRALRLTSGKALQLQLASAASQTQHDRPATRRDLEALRDAWESLESALEPSTSVPAAGVAATTGSGTSAAARAGRSQADADLNVLSGLAPENAPAYIDTNVIANSPQRANVRQAPAVCVVEDDDEYEPVPMPGVSTDPKKAAEPQATKRAPRKRPRLQE